MKQFLLLFILNLMLFFNTHAFTQNQTAVSDSNLTLIGRWTNGACFAVSVDGNTAYFGNGEYLEIVSFSDPLNPVELGKLSFTKFSSITDIALDGNYAYVGNGWNGLYVIDITNPANPIEIDSFAVDNNVLRIFISGNYAYIMEDTDGLHILDVSNPANPFEIGYYNTIGNAEGIMVSGNYAYIADGAEGLIILDITDPTKMTKVGSFATGGYSFQVVVEGNYAYVADGDDLYIIEVSDPSNPVEAGYLGTGGYYQDVVVNGNYAFLANGSAGLSIVDISNLSDIHEVGSFTTSNSSIKLAVSGNYIYVAAKEAGLYVLENNITTDINNDISNLPAKFKLSQNYPNPFNPTTTIQYAIPNLTHPLVPSREGKERSDRGVLQNITLKIYDILGNEVTTLVNEEKQPGVYEVQFDASKLSSGIYFYKLETNNFIKTRKMILIK